MSPFVLDKCIITRCLVQVYKHAVAFRDDMRKSWSEMGVNQILEIKRLSRAGKTDVEIAQELEKQFGHRYHRTSIYRARKKNPDLPKDSPFLWHCMAESRDYGLPWEASAFIMDMIGMIHRVNNGLTQMDGKAHQLTPTIHEVIWWWRVHQAAPEIAKDVGTLFDIYWLATSFVFRELIHDLSGVPMETEELELRIAVKPWLDEERHQEYHQIVDRAVVPYIQPGFEMIHAFAVVANMPLDWMMGRSIKQSQHPELLYSQQYQSRPRPYEVVPIILGEEKLIGKELLL